MKTPCLKCGLIHDEPTAICDGYAGIDPDKTAGDTRKKAAERIRAVLAAVPIESRPRGRARAAAAAAGAHTSQSPEPIRAVTSGPTHAEAPPAEVPEWRREVTERLESYRSRRERQARQAANGQTVLGFRVHSKTDTLEETPGTESAPMAPTTLASEAIVPHSIEEIGVQAIAATAVHGAEASPIPEEPVAMPTPMNAAPAASAGTIPGPATRNGEQAAGRPANGGQRSYQTIEEADLTANITAAETDSVTAAEAPAAPAALPIAGEPAVVLADSTTLEVHADPAELAEVQPAVPFTAHSVVDSTPLAAIPEIDTEYWRAQPSPASQNATEAGPEAGESECGSLTSGFESHATETATGFAETISEPDVEIFAEEEADVPAVPQPTFSAETTEEFPQELGETSVAPAVEETVLAEPAGTGESLFPGALEASEEEIDARRAALRTAARPPLGTPERIEISVPQPVFDFSAASAETQQPREQGPPVADLRERRCAAIFDGVILGITIAGFFLAFHLAGGEFSFSRVGAAVSIAAVFLIYAQYILLFTMVGGGTPGMMLRGLRAVCFDGRPPDQVELAWRGFGYLLSAAAGLLGFVWSAWDEHGLTWHDRISQTYITYAELAGSPAVASVS